MNVENVEQKTNELLKRREIDAYVLFEEGTPARSEIKKAVCQKIGANPDLSVLREVKSEYGIKRVKVTVHVYEDMEHMKKLEAEYLLKRDKIIGEKKEEAKPAEEAPKKEKKEEKPKEAEKQAEETKPEEKKEEVKEEKPKEEKKEA
ncbi:hypothetical protein JXB01_00525 [Candidatus Micrarchaeota archaeon]|nr:hypothetical protein [Candidatus Micrarchaeota archaeon]